MSSNKFYFTKCSKIDDEEIICVRTITNAGKYNIYLNGVKKTSDVIAYSSSLSKELLYIEPSTIKFESDTNFLI